MHSNLYESSRVHREQLFFHRPCLEQAMGVPLLISTFQIALSMIAKSQIWVRGDIVVQLKEGLASKRLINQRVPPQTGMNQPRISPENILVQKLRIILRAKFGEGDHLTPINIHHRRHNDSFFRRNAPWASCNLSNMEPTLGRRYRRLSEGFYRTSSSILAFTFVLMWMMAVAKLLTWLRWSSKKHAIRENRLRQGQAKLSQ